MRQTSEQFINEMMKDNTAASAGASDNHEQFEKMIDQKLDNFWKKFQNEVASLVPNVSDQVETPDTTSKENVDNTVENVDNMEGDSNNE